MDRPDLERILAGLPRRSLESTLFNLANAYAQASDAVWAQLGTTKNADLAGPAIMCQSFAIELLLKFFLVVDHPTAKTAEDLRLAGVRLKNHKYSELFDQLSSVTRDKIAQSFSQTSRRTVTSEQFRDLLIAQGDDPFVHWRYVYERGGVSHFDRVSFNLLTDALGKAAEVERRASAARAEVPKPPETAV
jgi:hypothetical protein